MVRIAFDWSPNTLHLGFICAKESGYYKEEGFEQVDFIFPQELLRLQGTAPIQVEKGQADFCLISPDDVVHYHAVGERPHLVAVASIVQDDLSAIAVKKDSGIKRPRDLDGKTFGSYGGHYEFDLLKQMIKNDGGKGDVKFIRPQGTQVWDQFLEGKCDAVSIYTSWQPFLARHKNIELTCFNWSDYNIPYLPGPLLACHPDKLASAEGKEMIRKFIRATTKGFAKCAAGMRPAEVEAMMLKNDPRFLEGFSKEERLAIIEESSFFVAPHFVKNDQWGNLDMSKLDKFIKWLCDCQMLKDSGGKVVCQSDIDIKCPIFTNEFLAGKISDLLKPTYAAAAAAQKKAVAPTAEPKEASQKDRLFSSSVIHSIRPSIMASIRSDPIRCSMHVICDLFVC